MRSSPIYKQNQISTEKTKAELLARTVERIKSSVSLEEVLQSTMDELREILDTSRCIIYELDAHGKYLVPLFESLDKDIPTTQYARLPIEASPPSAEVLSSGNIVNIEDLSAHLVHPAYKAIQHLVPCALLSMPLRARGRIVAGIALHECKAPRYWLSEEIELVASIADQIGMVLQNNQLFQEVQDRTRELEDTISKLEELIRQREEFTAILVHDIRSPLSAILGILELLETKAKKYNLLDESFRQLVFNGKDTLKSIVTLVNEILNFSKTEAGRIQLNIGQISVENFIEMSRKHIEILARRKGINLYIAIEPHVPILHIDIQQLLRALINLLSNAIKFTQTNGKIHIEVKTNFDKGKQFAIISITDTGPGISAKDLPYIFNPYYQAKQRAKHFLGTGLGLAIVKRILNAHGGDVTVESTKNVGSVFSLIFPII